MSKQDIYELSEIATAAQARIQRDFSNIDPIVSITSNMRKAGVPADAMTVDCILSKKRITFVIHDQQPGNVSYQFGYTNRDPASNFEHIDFSDITINQMYGWIKEYFS